MKDLVMINYETNQKGKPMVLFIVIKTTNTSNNELQPHDKLSIGALKEYGCQLNMDVNAQFPHNLGQ